MIDGNTFETEAGWEPRRVAYVDVELIEEHLAPSDDSRVVNRLDRGQRVEVFEESNGWSRVCTYYEHDLGRGQVARWVRTSSLSADKPDPPKHGLPATRLGEALAGSDDVHKYWRGFLKAAQHAIERGLATEDDFVEWGGWVRSGTDGCYFINSEVHIRGRVYLHAPTGKMAQWHPGMGLDEVARYLYEVQDGRCALCGVGFPLRNLEIDHIVPQSKGRIDKIANLQLLCSACNRVKGDRSMDYAKRKIR